MASYYENLSDVSLHKYIWFKRHAVRFSVYTWMAIREKLKMADLLLRRNIDINPSCSFCHHNIENHKHLFFECDYSFLVISYLLPQMNKFYMRPTLLQLLEHYDQIQKKFIKEKNFIYLDISSLVYILWIERNSRCFYGNRISPLTHCYSVRNAIKLKVSNWKNYEELQRTFPNILYWICYYFLSWLDCCFVGVRLGQERKGTITRSYWWVILPGWIYPDFLTDQLGTHLHLLGLWILLMRRHTPLLWISVGIWTVIFYLLLCWSAAGMVKWLEPPAWHSLWLILLEKILRPWGDCFLLILTG